MKFKIREEDTSYWTNPSDRPPDREFVKEFNHLQDAKWWIHWQSNIVPSEYRYTLLGEVDDS
jgi:hypothetical protein